MAVSSSFECYFDIDHFPRQAKRESSKRTNKKTSLRQKEITSRNMLQKEKQSRDKLARNYQEIERNEKQDGTFRTYYNRIYYCATCKREITEPCKCNYVSWCGKECDWQSCYQTTLLGVQDIIFSWDILCDYHALKQNEYFETFEKAKN
jgi:hypothetical protein